MEGVDPRSVRPDYAETSETPPDETHETTRLEEAEDAVAPPLSPSAPPVPAAGEVVVCRAKGPSAGQSTVIAVLDLVLGVTHGVGTEAGDFQAEVRE